MSEQNSVQMFVAGLLVDQASNSPILLLKDSSGNRCLPIWIGPNEATAIATGVKNIEYERPMTHDLLKNTIEKFGGEVRKVFIGSVKENTYYATIVINHHGRVLEIDSRPSDSVALAVRLGVPIVVSEYILKTVRFEVKTEQDGEDVKEELGQFVEADVLAVDCLNLPLKTEAIFKLLGHKKSVSNLSREELKGILKQSSPEDFNYMM